MLSRSRILARAAAPLMAVGSVACQMAPPPARIDAQGGIVRAATADEAREVAALLEALAPRVCALLPDARARKVDVWVQSAPTLSRFASDAYEEADGFWAQSSGRIHLRRDAESLERTLAHELVHASLGPSWDLLPGTLEEGLCDWVSAELCPQHAAYMRAGRLSAASFALGGLELEVALVLPKERHALGVEVGYTARVMLQGELAEPIDPMEVFEVHAGLSTTRMDPARKKALYGLAYLVVDRIAVRGGIEALHGLCLQAAAQGLREVPAAWLLDAAGIAGSEVEPWRAVLRDQFGDAELAQLLLMYPKLVVETLDRSFGGAALQHEDGFREGDLSLHVGLREGAARLELSVASW